MEPPPQQLRKGVNKVICREVLEEELHTRCVCWGEEGGRGKGGIGREGGRGGGGGDEGEGRRGRG